MYRVILPDWTSLDERKVIDSFPVKADAITYTKEVFGADSKGRIDTVFEDIEDTVLRVKLLVVARSETTIVVMTLSANSMVYLPYGTFSPEKDFTLRDTAVRIFRPLATTPPYAKSFLNCGVVENFTVFRIETRLEDWASFANPKINPIGATEVNILTDKVEAVIVNKFGFIPIVK